jgi:hypothetical protein
MCILLEILIKNIVSVLPFFTILQIQRKNNFLFLTACIGDEIKIMNVKLSKQFGESN